MKVLILRIKIEYSAQTTPARKASRSPIGLSFRITLPLKIIIITPTNAQMKPIKKFELRLSSPSKNLAAKAVRKGTNARIRQTLEA